MNLGSASQTTFLPKHRFTCLVRSFLQSNGRPPAMGTRLRTPRAGSFPLVGARADDPPAALPHVRPCASTGLISPLPPFGTLLDRSVRFGFVLLRVLAGAQFHRLRETVGLAQSDRMDLSATRPGCRSCRDYRKRQTDVKIDGSKNLQGSDRPSLIEISRKVSRSRRGFEETGPWSDGSSARRRVARAPAEDAPRSIPVIVHVASRTRRAPDP